MLTRALNAGVGFLGVIAHRCSKPKPAMDKRVQVLINWWVSSANWSKREQMEVNILINFQTKTELVSNSTYKYLSLAWVECRPGFFEPQSQFPFGVIRRQYSMLRISLWFVTQLKSFLNVKKKVLAMLFLY